MNTPLERLTRVALALDKAVSVLHSPMDNSLMVKAVAYDTGEGSDYVGHALNLFRLDHPAAKHDGEEFRYMGKSAKRWRWHPVAASPSRGETVEEPSLTPRQIAEAEVLRFDLAQAGKAGLSLEAWRELREIGEAGIEDLL